MLSFLSLKEHWILQPSLTSDVSICGFGCPPTIHTLQREFHFTTDTGMPCSIMEIFLLSCILRELLQPKFLPQAPCLCLFKENVPRTALEVSFHLNCVVKPRQMLLLMVSVREANEIIWIETARGVTDLSGSMAGREGCSPSRSFGAKPLSMLHQHILYRLFSRHQVINYVYPHVCYPHITNKLYCSRELVENHLQ